MRQLLQPIVSKFDELLRLMSVEPDADLQLAYAACISQAMGFARYASLSICTLAKLAPFLTFQLVCFSCLGCRYNGAQSFSSWVVCARVHDYTLKVC